MTGREIERALLAQVQDNEQIEILENHMAVDLLMESKAAKKSTGGKDRCIGAYVLNRATGEVETWRAGVTVLCTGGSGKVYLYTTNPDIATGDGVAMLTAPEQKLLIWSLSNFIRPVFLMQR